ncbi:hypothetical protein HYH02_001176 [Chlamydomonas schloesseri]|uniref:Uncharacterized protein n=1 Tax=Chlamydomonas schloesseri TaxID=2026947 RepID=A0A835WXH1_9CHLO|nr:hypothetical protein HYH02_001176 [Chlamydomonas schloesseri]|eukprot:KAG2454140.1 hypothetical protein HYH02_001176 [Chlamydomonas schloesseri]
MAQLASVLLKCLLLCAASAVAQAAASSGVPRRVLRGVDPMLPDQGGTLPTPAAATEESVLKHWHSHLLEEVSKLDADAPGQGLHIIFAGDLETRSLWQGLCAALGAQAGGPGPTEPGSPSSCQISNNGLVIDYVPVALCGQLSTSRALLAGAAVRPRAVVLGVSAKQGLHLGDRLPLRCPTSDVTAAIASLAGSVREALGDASVPIVLLGPAALCPHRLPPELEAAVHDAQAADPTPRTRMVAECTAALVARAAAAGSEAREAGEAAALWPSSSAAEAEAVCAMSLLTANGVEEWNAQVAGAVQLLQDSWSGAGAGGGAPSLLTFLDLHRLTKAQCAASAPAPGAAAAAAPEDYAAQVFPALAGPLLLEVVRKLAA